MKRTFLLICMLFFGASLSAQVEKQVEVLKDYVPKLPHPKRLDVTVESRDTIKMNPDVDYNIKPRVFSSALTTHRFRPAEVTYWTLRHAYPFYVKAGVGYPISTEVDAFATTERKDVGFLSVYFNHLGQFGKIKSLDPVYMTTFRGKATKSENRIGVNLGKYISYYTLSLDAFYRSNIYTRYPLRDDIEELQYPLREINFENLSAKLSFSDAFSNLKRLNFGIELGAEYFNDKSHCLVLGAKYRELDWYAKISMAVHAGKNGKVNFDLGFDSHMGLKELSNYRDNVANASFIYSYAAGRKVDFRAGVKCFYDMLTRQNRKNDFYFIPELYLGLNVGNGLFVPFVEVDGELQNNSFYSMLQRNPYLAELTSQMYSQYSTPTCTLLASSLQPSTIIYNVRFGIDGHLKNGKFQYRAYANYSHRRNELLWYNVNRLFFSATAKDMNMFTLFASLGYKPLSELKMDLAFEGNFYKSNLEMEYVKPKVKVSASVDYKHRKFFTGIALDVYSKSRCTSFYDGAKDVAVLPSYANLRFNFDYFLKNNVTLYLNLDNILNQNIYHYAFYKEYGIGFKVGVKVQF
ncbi:MAG: TonB-dependent receptor [Alistipes sp.]|nr:TonB-dependent receptor [Candidatus Alistipes equi]